MSVRTVALGDTYYLRFMGAFGYGLFLGKRMELVAQGANSEDLQLHVPNGLTLGVRKPTAEEVATWGPWLLQVHEAEADPTREAHPAVAAPDAYPDHNRVRMAFQQQWYKAAELGFMEFTWCGVHTLKCPTDLLVYAELLHKVRPDVVIETGTYRGGSALFLCHVLDAIGHGTVYSVDPAPADNLPAHPRARYVRGSSVDPAVVAWLQQETQGQRVLVILDGDHHREVVRQELEAYAPLVAQGSYVIVEDTVIHGNPVTVSNPQAADEDPMAAVQDFLASPLGQKFQPDHRCERFWLTWNPGGYLERMVP